MQFEWQFVLEFSSVSTRIIEFGFVVHVPVFRLGIVVRPRVFNVPLVGPITGVHVFELDIAARELSRRNVGVSALWWNVGKRNEVL